MDTLTIQIPDDGLTLEAFEREVLIYTLYLCEWNKLATCRTLGISAPKLYRMLQKHQILECGRHYYRRPFKKDGG